MCLVHDLLPWDIKAALIVGIDVLKYRYLLMHKVC